MSDDSPTERIHEDILDRAHEARERWINWAAATAAALAALAAVNGALSNHYLTVSSRDQIQSSDSWSHYQAKSIKAGVLQSKIDLLAAMNKSAPNEDRAKLDEYKRDLRELQEKAERQEIDSEAKLVRHEIIERGVTLFHIGIAVVAIAVLTKRPSFWYFSVLAGVVGIALLAQAFWTPI